MDANYLARNDGASESAGRGSGLEGVGPRKAPLTPHMQMTFAPLERRLDVAIFRAMFASSTRQARQFVIHGYVTVNGKKVKSSPKSLDIISYACICINCNWLTRENYR